MWCSDVCRGISRKGCYLCVFIWWFKDVRLSLLRWTVPLIQRSVSTMGSMDTQHSKYFVTDRNHLRMMGRAQLVSFIFVLNDACQMLIYWWCHTSQTDGIVDYMKKQAGPDSVPLHSEHDLEKFINHFDASVVGKCILYFCLLFML